MPKLKTAHLSDPDFWRETTQLPVVRNGGRLRWVFAQRRHYNYIAQPVHVDRVKEGFCTVFMDGGGKVEVPLSMEDTLLILRGQKDIPPALWKLCMERAVIADWERERA